MPNLGRMRKPKIIILAATMVVVACVWLTFMRSPPRQALAVSFIGYTNLPSGHRVVSFTVSNQCSITVQRSPVAFLESYPFVPKTSFGQAHLPTNWVMFFVGPAHPDIYLKPKATEQVNLEIERPNGEWRLRVPWSSGVRVRMQLALKKVPYFKLLERLRTVPVYYASSATIME